MNNPHSLPDTFKKNTDSSCPISNPKSLTRRRSVYGSFNFKTPDLEAMLVAETLPNNHWNLYLTNIRGPRIEFILGRSFTSTERLNVSDLLDVSIRDAHQEMVDNLFSEGAISPDWNFLFGNMFGRLIKIRNPGNDEPRFVKILMEDLKDVPKSPSLSYEFSVRFFDETQQHIVSRENISSAHDIRALARMGLETLVNSPLKSVPKSEFIHKPPQELSYLFEKIMDREQQACEIFEQTLNVFARSKEESPVVQPSSTSLLPIDETVNLFLNAQNFPLSLKLTGNTPLLLLQFQVLEILQQTLKSMIDLFLRYQISEIWIHHRCEEAQYICDIFSSMELPLDQISVHHPDRDLKTTLVNQHQVLLSRPAIFRHGLFQQDNLQSKIEEIKQQLVHNSAIPVILLADDVALNIKMMANYCTRVIKEHLQSSQIEVKKMSFSATPEQWAKNQIVLLDVGIALFIACANGDVASKVIEKIEVDAMITDMEMPGFQNGESLILWTKVYEYQNRKKPMKILMNTALNETDYLEKYPRLSVLNIPYVCKGGSSEKIDQLIHSILSEKLTNQFEFLLR